jgi:hypothetical protein
MIAVLIGILIWEPLWFQKEASAERLIAQMGAAAVQPEYADLFRRAECQITERGHMEIWLPGQVIPGTDVSFLLCTFPTACGRDGERVIFHRAFYGAFKPAESFSYQISEACPEMLKDGAPRWDQGG